MNREKAFEILDVNSTANAGDIKYSFEQKSNELQIQIANAPTDDLKKLYKNEQRLLEEAYDLLGSEDNSIGLPSLKPDLTHSKTEEKKQEESIIDGLDEPNKNEITENQALKLLELGSNCTHGDIEKQYNLKRTEFELEVSNAKLDVIKKGYESGLKELGVAYELLLSIKPEIRSIEPELQLKIENGLSMFDLKRPYSESDLNEKYQQQRSIWEEKVRNTSLESIREGYQKGLKEIEEAYLVLSQDLKSNFKGEEIQHDPPVINTESKDERRKEKSTNEPVNHAKQTKSQSLSADEKKEKSPKKKPVILPMVVGAIVLVVVVVALILKFGNNSEDLGNKDEVQQISDLDQQKIAHKLYMDSAKVYLKDQRTISKAIILLEKANQVATNKEKVEQNQKTINELAQFELASIKISEYQNILPAKTKKDHLDSMDFYYSRSIEIAEIYGFPTDSLESMMKDYKASRKSVLKNEFIAKKLKPFKDKRDGQSYKVVKIGEQTWMAENLNYKITKNLDCTVKSEKKGKWKTQVAGICTVCYDEKSENCKKYGRLYSRKAALITCPKGWHLPSVAEWRALIKYAGKGNKKLAFKRLKLGGESGFDGLYGGDGNGTPNNYMNFNLKNQVGFYWTSTLENYQDVLGYDYAFISDGSASYPKIGVYWNHHYDDYKSCRCLKN